MGFGGGSEPPQKKKPVLTNLPEPPDSQQTRARLLHMQDDPSGTSLLETSKRRQVQSLIG